MQTLDGSDALPMRRESPMATALIIDRTPHTLGSPVRAARARWATVRVETEGAVYVGRVYVPETKRRLSDVLADDRVFINLTEVTINDAQMMEPFVAVNKQYIRTIRVLSDGEPAMPMGLAS
jgi:hypothetical protein